MSISHQKSKEISTRKADSFTALDLPEVTPELIQHHIALGEQLRADTMRKLVRNGSKRIARAWQCIGQTVIGGASSPAPQSLCDQKPLPR